MAGVQQGRVGPIKDYGRTILFVSYKPAVLYSSWEILIAKVYLCCFLFFWEKNIICSLNFWISAGLHLQTLGHTLALARFLKLRAQFMHWVLKLWSLMMNCQLGKVPFSFCLTFIFVIFGGFWKSEQGEPPTFILSIPLHSCSIIFPLYYFAWLPNLPWVLSS